LCEKTNTPILTVSYPAKLDNQERLVEAVKPRLSVIIPCRNSAKFVRDTLQTISTQTSKDFECIVIDGGSTDGTQEILREYAWLHTISESDSGYHDALLKGLDLARGEFVTQCCMSDGYISNSWFETAIKSLDENPDCDLVWGYPQSMSEKGNLERIAYPQMRIRKPLGRNRMFLHYLVSGFHLPEINYVVRRSAIDACFRRQPGTVPDNLDFESWLEFENNFHESGRLTLPVSEVVSFGRRHDGSLTNTQSDQNRKYWERFQTRRRVTRRKLLQDTKWTRSGFILRANLLRAATVNLISEAKVRIRQDGRN